MKNLIKISTYILFVCLFISCSTSEQVDQVETNTKLLEKSNTIVLTSSDGYTIAESISELTEMIFREDANNVQITDVEFLNVKNKNGAAANVSYIKDGITSMLGFSIGDIEVKHEAANVEFQKLSSAKGVNFLVFRCRGNECCKSTGTSSGSTHTFVCACQGSSQNNQLCTMTISSDVKTLKQ